MIEKNHVPCSEKLFFCTVAHEHPVKHRRAAKMPMLKMKKVLNEKGTWKTIIQMIAIVKKILLFQHAISSKPFRKKKFSRRKFACFEKQTCFASAFILE